MPLIGTTGPHVSRKLTQLLTSSGFFPYLVSIQAKTETRTNRGGTTYAWADVSGMEAVRCAKVDRIPDEQRTVEVIEEDKHWTFMLNGYYPSIDPTMRAVADSGEIFDIVGVDSDSQHTYTTLTVRLPVPAAQPGV